MPATNQARVVDILRELQLLLELSGANPFKSGAYERAARALEGGEYDLGLAVSEGTLTDIPGIGGGIADKITDIWQTGSTGELETLRSQIPAGLVEMTRLAGMGPKKIHAVHAELGIDSIEGLAAACRDGRIAALKGFGEKTAQKLLKAIEARDAHRGLYRADVALATAAGVLEDLREHPDVLRVDLAGALRRRLEVVPGLEFVVATSEPAAVLEFFTTRGDVTSVVSSQEHRATVILPPGIQADLHCVAPEEFPWALNHFTGSPEHTRALQALAMQRGRRLDEHGLFAEGSQVSLAAEDEADVYRHLGLPHIEPELRENMGEIEAAHAGSLPALITRDDIVGMLHMHTHYSDGTPGAADYARWARSRRIKWMGIADHSQSAAYAGGLKPHRVREQHAEIDQVNAEWAGRGVRLLKGIESDILVDGSLDYSDDVLETFDFVVASVHSRFQLPEAEQTARIIRAIENPYTTVLGHPTGRLLLEREGYAVDLKAVIAACARCGVAIEINANPPRLDLDWRLVHHALEQGCYISIGPDAHDLQMLEAFDFGLGIARKGWVTRDRALNCMSAEAVIAFSRRRRGGGAAR